MSIPNYQEFMLPILKLAAKGNTFTIDAVDEMAREFNISEEDRNKKIASGTGLFYGRVSWAITYLVQAGLLKRLNRGCFTITQEGQNLLSTNPTKVSNKTLAQYQSFKDFKNRSKETTKKKDDISKEEIEDLSPEENIQKSVDNLNNAISSELLDRILLIKPKSFETLILDLLTAMGYSHNDKEGCHHTGQAGDDGIDGIVYQDVLGVDKIYIQAKRYAIGRNIGPDKIRDFMGGLDLHRANKGIFVTTSDYTSQAISSAKQATRNVVLINGDMLTDLMIKYNVGCEAKSKIEIKKIDEDYFEDK